MTQPNMPNLPGFDAMADTLEFVKKMWGGAHASTGIPGMVMPTLSLDEINKQIADLKAVESWLNMNMNMLRGTIQALEVQGATISTLQAMGKTMGATAFGADAHADSAPPAGTGAEHPAHAADAAHVSADWWNLLQQQFNQAVSGVMAEEARATAMHSGKPSAAAAAKKTAATSEAKPDKKPRKKRAPPAKP
ncbi:PhaM family polyhydroxyalkanoate granule multifunctional regulatory protein [Herminiimonas sp. NPDC097707]|uniref:PhaM family polyhydroxyalkanoate granule multifunctional regulatory protein n=1 Tax=Herminiimonas sp. NPDC097707 TaxID=3364007 RepID=UPI00383AF3E9